jgi:hypothetical protein
MLLPDDILNPVQRSYFSGVFGLRSYIGGAAFWTTGRQGQFYHNNRLRGKSIKCRRAKV